MPEIEIIDNPKLKSFLRTVTEAGFTTLMWGGWIYLFLPLLNIILWYFGIRLFYLEVVQTAGYKEFFVLLGRVGWSILIIFAILRLWGFYNLRRFGKRNRRTQHPADQENAKMAAYFHLTPSQCDRIRSSREAVWPVIMEPELDVQEMLSTKQNPDLLAGGKTV